MESKPEKLLSPRDEKKRLQKLALQQKQDKNVVTRHVRRILKKRNDGLQISEVESVVLGENGEIVDKIQNNMTSRTLAMKRKLGRNEERMDSEKEVETSARIVAERLVQCRKEGLTVLVYTGAGISTAADISDYRGPEGVWTKLAKNESVHIEKPLTRATPTETHIILKDLLDAKLITHIVSQNCDGLHIRSGIPSDNISEIHGNMFAERCKFCLKSPVFRIFDVTENTRKNRHGTGRSCPHCKKAQALNDTIVHFGEINPEKVELPYNWKRAIEVSTEFHGEKLGCILTLGTSLRVLKEYKLLWPKPKKDLRTKLYIVNLQWTSKDSNADLKIHAKCDDFCARLRHSINTMLPASKRLKKSTYSLCEDSLWKLAVPVNESETSTFNTLAIHDNHPKYPDSFEKDASENAHSNISKFSIDINHISNLEDPITTPGWYIQGFKKK